MSPDAARSPRPVVDLGQVRAHGTTPVGLRARWRDASAAAGWRYPSDWWVPAVDAVAEAVCAGTDLAAPAQRLGATRADAGIDMTEVLVDVEALCRAATIVGLQDRADEATLLHHVAVGWAEKAPQPTGATPMSDPLTALVTGEYLSTRLGEIYREAEATGQYVPRSYALVVVSLLDSAGAPQPSTPERVAADPTVRMVAVAEAMRSVFSAGETIAQVRPTTAVALVPREENLAVRVALLRQLVERRRMSWTGVDGGSVAVWIEGLPSNHEHALSLLRELGR